MADPAVDRQMPDKMPALAPDAHRPTVLAYAALGSFVLIVLVLIAVFTAMTFSGIKPDVGLWGVIFTMVGTLGGWVGSSFNWDFGSSRGSRDAQATMAEIAKSP